MSNPQLEPSNPLNTLTTLLQTAIRLPPPWFKLILSIALLSVCQVSWSESEGWALSLNVTNTTVLVLLAAWLPALLQLFTLVGGMIKTPTVEVSSLGLEQFLVAMSTETKEEAVGALNTILEVAQQSASGAEKVYLQDMENKLADEYGGMMTPQQARQEMKHLAQRYQALQSAPTGTRRNFLFEAIAGAMRALVLKGGWSDAEIASHLSSEHEGRRLVGLSCLAKMEEAAALFPQVLEIIADSRSAFEQMNALQVMEKMLPRLNEAEKAQLQEVLTQQRNYDVSQEQWIRPGSDRRLVSDRLLAVL